MYSSNLTFPQTFGGGRSRKSNTKKDLPTVTSAISLSLARNITRSLEADWVGSDNILLLPDSETGERFKNIKGIWHKKKKGGGGGGLRRGAQSDINWHSVQ